MSDKNPTTDLEYDVTIATLPHLFKQDEAGLAVAVAMAKNILQAQENRRSKNASVARKPQPTKPELLVHRANYLAINGKERGWVKEVSSHYEIHRTTISRILKEK